MYSRLSFLVRSIGKLKLKFYLYKQALEWIHDNGEFYLSSHTSEGETDKQAQELLREHSEFKEVAEVYEVKCSVCFILI